MALRVTQQYDSVLMQGTGSLRVTQTYISVLVKGSFHSEEIEHTLDFEQTAEGIAPRRKDVAHDLGLTDECHININNFEGSQEVSFLDDVHTNIIHMHVSDTLTFSERNSADEFDIYVPDFLHFTDSVNSNFRWVSITDNLGLYSQR